ncbi:hypothetical protein LOTGIDRAFT_149763 [Lottia gigantea]|uniref:Transmembrane protein 244 n=1 Tax=Lottia gigantea TaxID=225164 RepID=V4A9B4_LOTGI|nr:hypothetical protein LOTGIDRAFT_149763 [Lottia gigantea]ESP00579.1 hypothetical protein LOTGIDRAFT_149763 [Lottia gigantea]
MGELSTKDILFNILKCFVTFYATYFVISSICFASFRLSVYDGRIPFDFKTWVNLTECCTGYSHEQTVNVISMLVTFPLSGIFYGLIVRSRAWDYAVTVTLLHIVITCLVLLDFPLDWSWWVCLASALILKILAGEMVCFLFSIKKKVKVKPEIEFMNGSYLYRKK